jgi:hypothetical protein
MGRHRYLHLLAPTKEGEEKRADALSAGRLVYPPAPPPHVLPGHAMSVDRPVGQCALARCCDGYSPRMGRYVFDPSWLEDVPPPRRPLLLFDGG